MTTHAHTHSTRPGTTPVSLRTRVCTFALLFIVALGTIVGLIQLWPSSAQVADLNPGTQYATSGVTLQSGEVLGITPECPAATATQSAPSGSNSSPLNSASESCLEVDVGLRSGPEQGRLVTLAVRGPVTHSGLAVGDHVELSRYPVPLDGSTENANDATYKLSQTYTVTGIFRHVPLLALALVFAAVVIWVGRLRGLLALIALAISAGVLFTFVLPALVAGSSGLLVGMVGASAIMFVILYLVHGPNMRTTAALIGTLCGILIMAGISLVSVHVTRLSGISDESSALLQSVSGTIDFRGLLTCSIIIAGLGVLNDVTITQASSVWELRAAAPSMPRSELYLRAMRIGRDHIASTVYTVFFAYVGAALSVLIMLYLYDQPFLSLLTREDIAIEIVRTFCGSIGLILAVPITTWVAALFAGSSAPATAHETLAS